MSDEIVKHGHAGHNAEFEHEDLGSRGVFIFLIALAVSVVVIYFMIVGMYRFLDHYERSQMATASPLVTSKGTISRIVTQEDMEKDFKGNGAPMLETNERLQMRDFLMEQENQLNSYGWVDEKAGVAHIPIDRAMAMMVERGVPVYKQGTEAKADAGVVAASDQGGKKSGESTKPKAKGKSAE